jgi:CheY-like chemotaxis protein
MGERDGSSRSGKPPTSASAKPFLEPEAPGVVLGRVQLRRTSSRPPPRPIARSRPRPFVSPDLHGMRILAVEDDADLQLLFKLQLELCGAGVSVAGSCRDARASLTGAEWDLMVADIGLPDGSGHELAVFARGLARPPACIALSGSGSQDDVDAARRAGFRMHLTKPCDPGMLARVAAHFRRAPER